MIRTLSGREGGIATVELALILPVLILLLVGAVDIAVGVNAYATVAGASREGATYAVNHPSAAPSAIASAVTARSVPLPADQLTITATYYNGSTFVPWPAGGLPAGSPSPRQVTVAVEVSYPWSATAMLIGSFFNGGNGVTFRSRSQMATRW